MYEGKLVRLRAFDNSDLMHCLNYSNDYEVMRGASGAILFPSTVDDEARAMGQNTSYTSGEYQFAIETIQGNRFIGKCGFTRVNWKNRLAELEAAFNRDAQAAISVETVRNGVAAATARRESLDIPAPRFHGQRDIRRATGHQKRKFSVVKDRKRTGRAHGTDVR